MTVVAVEIRTRDVAAVQLAHVHFDVVPRVGDLLTIHGLDDEPLVAQVERIRHTVTMLDGEAGAQRIEMSVLREGRV